MDQRDEELYGKHADELIRFATTLVGPSLAEDIVASGVLKAMTSPAWKSVVEPRPYLFRSILNEARATQRSTARRTRREYLTAGREASEDALISIEVRDAMQRLSLRQRSVLHLAYWHDLSIAEIAETLGLSHRTTERALTQARTTLEAQLR